MFDVKGFAIEEDKYCHLSKSLIKEKEEKIILHVMYLMLPNIRAHQTLTKEERRQWREFKATQVQWLLF